MEMNSIALNKPLIRNDNIVYIKLFGHNIVSCYTFG